MSVHSRFFIRLVNWIESLVRGTPLFRPALFVYRLFVRRFTNISGWYTIDVEFTNIKPFQFYLPEVASGRGKRERVYGTYEHPVMKALSDRLSTDTAFWEIGAQWGYFSAAMAGTAERVLAFERNSDSVALLRRNRDANDFDNFGIQEGEVGTDVHLDEFEPPDLILMDIEGWELTILRNADKTLAANPTWVIEVHEPSMLSPDTPPNDPDEIRSVLETNGYTVSKLNPRSSENYHIIAEPK